MQHKKFSYSNIDELTEDLSKFGPGLEVSENLEALKRQTEIEGRTLHNSMAIHPMEGCDGERDGSPGELTIRRYERFAGGGAGLLWFEAVAVVREGRANPRQLWVTKENVHKFRALSDKIAEDSLNANGYAPLVIMQLTHSGRFSVPDKDPQPVIAYHNPYLNKRFNIPESHPVITDGELERLEDEYVTAALLAKEAGFHGVDIKGCHRYIISELFSAYDRPGKYGGSFENRTRFYLNIIDKVKSVAGSDFIVATRLNIYDGIPYGWGVDKDDYTKPDFAEPLKLVDILYDRGVRLVNITMGTPYYNPHVNRPYDIGGYVPEESPLEGVARLVDGAGVVQKRHPDMTVVGTGYSWLRHLAPFVAAGALEAGKAKIAGWGRGAFAYPDFAKDIVEKDMMEKNRCCISCSKCTELMRAKSFAGCVIRDSEVYGPLYKRDCAK